MPVFTANVPGTLSVGDRVEIGGKIKDNAKKMSVNLCAQEGEEPRDVVLHFDARFHRDNIVSLSRKHGVWIGSGNYDTNYNMFVPGTNFRIIFEVKDADVITIYCQGKFHSNFLPKIPISSARFLVAWADIERVTHCYFRMGKETGDSEVVDRAHAKIPPSPRPLDDDMKGRCGDNRRCRSPEQSATSDGEGGRREADGRDKFIYDALVYRGSPRDPRRRERRRGHYEPDSNSPDFATTDAEQEDSNEKKRGRRNVLSMLGKNGRR